MKISQQEIYGLQMLAKRAYEDNKKTETFVDRQLARQAMNEYVSHYVMLYAKANLAAEMYNDFTDFNTLTLRGRRLSAAQKKEFNTLIKDARRQADVVYKAGAERADKNAAFDITPELRHSLIELPAKSNQVLGNVPEVFLDRI